MSVVHRDQGGHGYRVLLPPFCTRLVLDPTYTALGRAWPQGCCKAREARPAGRVVHISVLLGLRIFDSHFGRFLQGEGEGCFNLIPTTEGWGLMGRETERAGQAGRETEGEDSSNHWILESG